MTATDNNLTSTSQAYPDYQKTVRVDASPDALFEALTNPAHLSGWWTPAAGNGDTGGELNFFMNAPEPLVVHVERAIRATVVEWVVTDCSFEVDWVGTRPTFAITPLDGETCQLEFRHVGLTAQLDCIDACTRGWDHYIGSLRDYVATGQGSPKGSPRR